MLLKNNFDKEIKIIEGGVTRSESVKNGLNKIIPTSVKTEAIRDNTEKNCSLNSSTSISNHDKPGPGPGIALKIKIIIAVPTTVSLKS